MDPDLECDSEEEEAFVYVYDRRASSTDLRRYKVLMGALFSFQDFQEKLCEIFSIAEDENFLVCDTVRKVISDDNTFLNNLDIRDTVYLMDSVDQELSAPVSEKIKFQPHYDTIVKSGVYEYYASEGLNPLPFAFAELIDNSLAATVQNDGERIIELSLHFDHATNNHVLCVYDNGRGMTSKQLNDWAVYRLSKFNRKDRENRIQRSDAETPKSLNSDISWFGVGGKQAIFFIGSCARIITKPPNSHDVHEFTMSTEEFKRREKNKENIFSGYIRNRKAKDASHVTNDHNPILSEFISSEKKEQSFTRVVIDNIKPEHAHYLKDKFHEWTRQLAHIYHYYIHGPEGNTVMSKTRRNVGALDVQIKVSMFEQGDLLNSVEMGEIDDDYESRHVRSAVDSFDFTVTCEDEATVEGILRYHPFLYDKETFPTPTDDTDDDDFSPKGPPARGRRPIFECYWNGRLIPYTFINDFDWCRVPRKLTNFPIDCYYRISGCLFTNDKFKVSTNKLTFIDLDAKLREDSVKFNRVILGERQTSQIKPLFYEWLKDCHEKYDKQIKFLNFSSSIVRQESGSRKNQQSTWTIYKAIQWDGKKFKKGQLVRTTRTNPVIVGTLRRFLLSGDYNGDTFAVGGEFEMIQEPQTMYGDYRSFPLSKLDRTATPEQCQSMLIDEQIKLPSSIEIKWPDKHAIANGQIFEGPVTIGSISAHILNRDGDPIQYLTTTNGVTRLVLEQKVSYKATSKDKSIELSSHLSAHRGNNSPYVFKETGPFTRCGSYKIKIQTVLAEGVDSKYAEGNNLPTIIINFCLKQAPPYKFVIGLLESPLRIGQPFNIPLNMQDKYGHETKAGTAVDVQPELSARGLEFEFGELEAKDNTLIIKDVVALGKIKSQQGESFSMTVVLPGFERNTQTMRVRWLPGKPHALKLTTFDDGEQRVSGDDLKNTLVFQNSSEISLGVELVDRSENVTSNSNLKLMAKFSGSAGLPTLECDCSEFGGGTGGILKGKIAVKQKKPHTVLTCKVEAQNKKSISPLNLKFLVKPATGIRSIEVYYKNPLLPDNHEKKLSKIRKGHTLKWKAGELVEDLSFRLIDETKTVVPINNNLASKLKVNWTDEASLELFEQNKLPDIPVPKNVADVRFFQVMFNSEKSVEFTFKINPICADVAGLRVSNNVRHAKLGVVRQEPVRVGLLDTYGNTTDLLPEQVQYVTLKADGLDETKLTKTLEDNQVVFHDIQFNQGPIGTRELIAYYNDISTNHNINETFVLQLLPGTPVTLDVQGWPDIEKPLPILSGTKIKKPIKVQLMDGWGNPCTDTGIKILLGKDSALKLSPTPSMIKSENGSASFPVFSVVAKCGIHTLTPRAVIGRESIMGPELNISVIANTENPVKITFECEEGVKPSVTVGQPWLNYHVTVLSEEGSPVTSTQNICMVIWKGDYTRNQSTVPSNAEWHRAVTYEGKHSFTNIKSSTKAGQYSAMFLIPTSRNGKSFTLHSQPVAMHSSADSPCCIEPLKNPGTPTVSNTKQLKLRTIIEELELNVKDQYGNKVSFSAPLTVTIQPIDISLKDDQVPKFRENRSSRTFNVINGEATLKDVALMEKSPGTDSSEYNLHCEINSSRYTIKPYMLQFIFYNDTQKQGQMKDKIRRRDYLQKCVKTFEDTFNMHKALYEEYNKVKKDVVRKRDNLIKKLNKLDVTSSAVENPGMVSELIKLNESNRAKILKNPKRRRCLLEKIQDGNKDVLGKVGHLALIEDDAIARVLSWHLAGEMDCLIANNQRKAKEIYRLTNGRQEILPLDGIFRGGGNWDGLLPHEKAGNKIKRQIPGNPIFARHLLNFIADEKKCKLVFQQLLGETLVLDSLDSGNEYRKMVINANIRCPTILTREGDRIKSTGKFGGRSNKAPLLENLQWVFGAPNPKEAESCAERIELLTELREVFETETQASMDLDNLEIEMNSEETASKRREYEEFKSTLAQCDQEITSMNGNSRTSAPPRQSLEAEATPKKRARRN